MAKTVKHLDAARRIALETRAVETWAHTGAAPATQPIIARMQEIFEKGEYDWTDTGCFRKRRGPVGAETMTCLVQEMEGDLLLIFVSDMRRGHLRRLLVTRDAEIWLDVDGTAIPHWGKYAAAAVTIMAKRAFEREQKAAARTSSPAHV